jgi:NADH-quinone oxidoreductase subunit L
VWAALWFSNGARVDHLYKVVFVLPFVRLVRWLNGYRHSLADPVGSLPVIAAIRATGTIVAPLRHDALDRVWMLCAGGMVALWGSLRRIQTGRTRDYALAMAAGTAALVMLAWGSS